MQNRITVTVQGRQYTLLAAEDQEYVQRVAAYVDEKLAQTASQAGMAMVDCAVLTALNLADERFKEQQAAENLRRQIKDLLEESAKQKLELSEAKREIFKLQQRK